MMLPWVTTAIRLYCHHNVERKKRKQLVPFPLWYATVGNRTSDLLHGRSTTELHRWFDGLLELMEYPFGRTKRLCTIVNTHVETLMLLLHDYGMLFIEK